MRDEAVRAVPGARRLLRGFAMTAALVAFALAACSDDVEVGAFDSKLVGAGGAASDGGNCVPTLCGRHTYECGNCIDDDFDGLVDSDDPDCLGPCDATENSYYGGIPGQNNAPCSQDCYFDQDTGSGNDRCYWDQRCDPLSVAPDYPPSGDSQCAYDPAASIPGTSATCTVLMASQLLECETYCRPLTPNGCDCFGCCNLPAGSNKFVWIGSVVNGVGSCDSANVNDPSRCKPCTPVLSCFNPCDACKVCIGRPDVDPTCPKDGGPPDAGGVGQCPLGVQPCGLKGELPCDAGKYCITGCCFDVPA